MVGRTTRRIVLGLALALAVTSAPSALAKATLLKRSGSNLMGAPVDAILAPWTFGETFLLGLYLNKRYSAWEKVLLTPLWSAVYIPACGFMSAMLPAARFVEGAAMLPVGVATAGSDYDWAVFEPLPSGARYRQRNAIIQKPPFYMGTRWCKGFFD